MKRLLTLVLALLAFMTLVFMLNGCVGRLSGTYVNPDDDSNYLVFEGQTVTLYEDGNQTRSGIFRESARTSTRQYLLTITYEVEGSSFDERYLLDESKETIYSTIIDENNRIIAVDVVFVKLQE
jgi:hypothetical protein